MVQEDKWLDLFMYPALHDQRTSNRKKNTEKNYLEKKLKGDM